MKHIRGCGVLMHISSLWGDYSCGSFGRAAEEWIDFLAECGFRYWQVLPFGIPDGFHSPYKSFSAFAGNPYFLDLPTLAEKGYLRKEELEAAKQKTPYSCEFDRLDRERWELLRKAAKRALESPETREEVSAFLTQHPHIAKFCRFMALRRANGNRSFAEWDPSVAADPSEIAEQAFLQKEFLWEWERIRTYAAKQKVKIIGDIPFYLDYESCDVWANPGEFLLDAQKRPEAVAGVPPDYFCPDGQLWGNPLYNWENMKETGFSFWRDRLSHMFRLFDGVRIDHFRAVESYWSVPASAETAKEGEWKKGPGMELVRALWKTTELCSAEQGSAESASKFLIAEDLGDVDEAVHSLVRQSGFPGMRVLQFGNLSDGRSPHLPHNYPADCIAYTGTHDNNTLLGFVWSLDSETRRRLLSYCGYTYPGDSWDRPEAYDAVIRTLYASHADTVIFPVQDLLRYGSDTRMNTPGTVGNNWLWRMTKEQLNALGNADRARLREWAKLYGRTP